MANILYGVNGEGAGHSTRAREVITHLQRQGHRVHVASFDRGLQNLSSICDVIEIHGLRFAYVNNQVRYRRTIATNLLTAPRAVRSLKALCANAKELGIEVVITDFEPLSCKVGRHLRLPVISIDNQHCLTNARVSYPHKYAREAAAAKLVTRMMTPHADAYLVISFFQAQVKKQNTFLFPPILRSEVLEAKPSAGSEVLVYVTSPSPSLVAILRGIRQRFICYGFGREGTDENLVFRKPSLDGFLLDLAACKAIVANSGFSLVSEALHLGKPYLACPVKLQFEQIFNAFYLQQSGYGAYWEELNRERVESFLFNVEGYAEKLKQYPREDNAALLSKLDEFIARSISRRRGTSV